MQDHIKSSNIKYRDRKLLVSDSQAREILLSTKLIQWYLKHGLRITKIHEVIEYVAKQPFTEFVKEITEKRKEGSRNPNKAVLAQTYKLIGNSSYGSMLMNKLKFEKTTIVAGEQNARERINSPNFIQLSQLGGNMYEVEESYSKLALDIPIQIGFQILQLAKLRMLEFAYDFVANYIERPLYQYLYCDTDSLYFSFSKGSLEECVIPSKKKEFFSQLQGYCGKNRCSNPFLSRTCCKDHQFEDDKEPGLLKVEFAAGDIFIGLCSKTYVCRSSDSSLKLSCKGVNKSTILGQGGVIEMFKATLSDKQSRQGVNSGIRQYKMGMYSYIQKKDAFSYLYVKRCVDESGIYTTPLNIVLNPVPCSLFPIEEIKEIGIDFRFSFKYGKWRFTTLYQAMVYFKVLNSDCKENEQSNFLRKVMRGKRGEIEQVDRLVPSSIKWMDIMFWQIKDVIRKRLSQIPNAVSKLKGTHPLSLVYCNKLDHIWCAGEEWRVIRWLPTCDVPGKNYLGEIYESMRKEIM